MVGNNKARFESVHSFIKFSEYRQKITRLSATERKKIYRTIETLEESLGLSRGGLVQHPRGSNPYLTPLGAKLLPEAVRLIRTIDAWKEQVQFYEKNRSGKISIGIRGSHWNLLKDWFLEVSRLLGEYMDLELKANYPDVLGSMLDERELDLCILYEGHGRVEGYKSIPISTQNLLLLVRLPDGVDADENINLDKLKNMSNVLDYIYIDKDQNFKKMHDRKLDDPYFRFPAVRFTDTSIAIDYFVSDLGKGACGLFPNRSIRGIESALNKKDSLSSLRIVEDIKISRNLELYYRVSNEGGEASSVIDESQIMKLLRDSRPGTLATNDRFSVVSYISHMLTSHIKANSPRSHIPSST